MTADPQAPHIGLVVEGPGDANAVPSLLRRHLQANGCYQDILGKPVTCHGREKALKPKGLEGFVAVAAARPGCRAIVVILDGEGDPVCELGPKLLNRLKNVTSLPTVVSLADRSFEDWVYASAETLQLGLTFTRGTGGTKAIVDALRPVKYVKPTWQPRLTNRMDIALAAGRNAGLQRLLHRFDGLLPFVGV